MSKRSMRDLNNNQASSKDDGEGTSIEDDYHLEKPAHFSSFQPYFSQNSLQQNQHLKSVENFDKRFMTSFPEFTQNSSNNLLLG